MPTLLEVRPAKPSARQLKEARANLDHCALMELRPAQSSEGRLNEARTDLDRCALMGTAGGDEPGQSVGFDPTAPAHHDHPSKPSRSHGPVL